MANYPDLEFVRELDGLLPDGAPLRLYRSRYAPSDRDQPVAEYRYHFGFPRRMEPRPENA